jgi:PilZ domain-containing protein
MAMQTAVESPAAKRSSAVGENGLIPQPEKPSSFPIRVPVVAEMAGSVTPAEVIGSTGNVLLLQAGDAKQTLPSLGTPVRVRVDWDRQLLSGRLAAHGVAGRFLVSMGERAIRRSRRFTVDLTGSVKSAHLYGPVEVHIADLSTGGARVEGLDLPVGSELDLCFTPPGRPGPINVLGFVVRSIDGGEVPTVGVAFRLVQPSMDVLARNSSSGSQ